MPSNSNIIASIDIGCSKIVILLADEQEDGILDVFASGIGASAGIEKGLIVDIDALIEAIKSVVKFVQDNYNTKFNNVVVNISDPNLTTLNRSGQVVINDKQITAKDIKSAINTAMAIPTPTNKLMIYQEPNCFNITLESSQVMVSNPLGMQAQALNVQMHLVSVFAQTVQNIKQSLDDSGLGASIVMPSSLASSAIYVSQDEKEQGVCLLDIGAANTDLSVFIAGSIHYSAVIQSAGEQITKNIASAFNTSFAEAERLKIQCNCAETRLIQTDKLIEFRQTGADEVSYLSHQELAEVIEGGYLSLFAQIRKKLKTEKLERILKAGFLLSGGGSKALGCADLLMRSSRIKAKMASCNTDKIIANQRLIIDPVYGCALGLLLLHNHIPYLQTIQANAKPYKGKIKKLLGANF